MDYEAYSRELENIIMDELLPMYLVGCRSSGSVNKQNSILVSLMEARRARGKEICALLRPNHAKTNN